MLSFESTPLFISFTAISGVTIVTEAPLSIIKGMVTLLFTIHGYINPSSVRISGTSIELARAAGGIYGGDPPVAAGAAVLVGGSAHPYIAAAEMATPATKEISLIIASSSVVARWCQPHLAAFCAFPTLWDTLK